jgi:hypothetical protein
MTKETYQKRYNSLLKGNLSIKTTQKRNPIKDKEARASLYML